MAERKKIVINLKDRKRESSAERVKETNYRERADMELRRDKKQPDDKQEEEKRGRSLIRKEPVEEDNSEQDEMIKLMGFGGFGTTKNKKVKGSNVYSVSKEKATQYRQYMNRSKGFNRPLSPDGKKNKK